MIATSSERFDNPQEFFKYEMCSYPPALFDSPGLLKKANKSVLADEIWMETKDCQTELPQQAIHYVIDGGALLHRVAWPHSATFESIICMYVNYVSRKYSKLCTVVFDGYNNGPSTKDCIHQRRYTRNMPTINFVFSMICSSRKEDFLGNPSNKQRMINFLSFKLKEAGFKVLHAKGDADSLIVKTAVESACNFPITAVVGDDTDLLILLLYHVNLNSHEVFFTPEP
jgi:hypothetical protein